MANPPANLVSLHGRRIGIDPDTHLVIQGRHALSNPFIPKARVVLDDDFLGPSIVSDRWDGVIGTSTAAVLPTIVAGAGGVARLTTGQSTNGTLATNGCQLHSELNWQASKGNLSFEARVKLDVITAARVFIGFTDQVSALESPISSTGGSDTLIADATDAVGFVFDTAMTTDDWWAAGVAAGTVATSVDTALAPTAATYQKFRIEIDSTGSAQLFIDGNRVATVASAVTSTVPLTPVICTTALSSAAKLIDVDYIHCAQDR